MKRERGFTLIELLVSVSIISVLISLTLPALSSARRLCLRTNCQTRLREVGQALWAYSVANDSCVPYVISPMTNGSTGKPGYGQPNVPDADINPFDVVKWPNSLQNLLLPLYQEGWGVADDVSGRGRESAEWETVVGGFI
jgi:prepilin-type N-terminal cleavage/methylation domain-containing protein